MIQLFKMAIRDLRRNRRRSLFSALALGIGLALLLLMASFIQGEVRGSMNTTIRLQSGHLQIRAASYKEEQTSLAWEDLIEAPDQLAAKIAALDAVDSATPRLYASGIVTVGEQSEGVRIFGLDPAAAANQPYRDGLLSGAFLTADDREGVLIGQPLADKLGIQVNDTVTLLANTSNGEIDQQPFTVRGVYSTQTPAFDQSTVFMPLAKAQTITQAENHASAIFVLLKDREQAAAVAAALQTQQYQVLTWQDMNGLLVQTQEMSNSYMVVLYLIVLAITATVIVNTLVMSVFERTREIGILSAIGMKSRSIMGMFFIESTLLAFGGILMGLVLGIIAVSLAAKYGFYIGNMGVTGILLGERIYAYLAWQDVIQLSLTALFVTLCGALYPALLAARMEPVEALHGGN